MLMAADAEATLPMLIEAVKAAIPATARRRSRSAARRCSKAKPQARERTRQAAALGWDASPISTARLTRGDLGRRSRTSTGRWSAPTGR